MKAGHGGVTGFGWNSGTAPSTQTDVLASHHRADMSTERSTRSDVGKGQSVYASFNRGTARVTRFSVSSSSVSSARMLSSFS